MNPAAPVRRIFMSVRSVSSIWAECAHFHRIGTPEQRHDAGMSGSSCHRDLIVWNKAVELASAVYAATAQLPREERSRLGMHLRRAALSVSSNIALGTASPRRAELVQCLHQARGSLAELEAQIAIAVTQLWLSADGSLSRRIAEIDHLLAHSIASAGKDALAAHARACDGRPLA
jgi:four helix bundle protein